MHEIDDFGWFVLVIIGGICFITLGTETGAGLGLAILAGIIYLVFEICMLKNPSDFDISNHYDFILMNVLLAFGSVVVSGLIGGILWVLYGHSDILFELILTFGSMIIGLWIIYHFKKWLYETFVGETE